MQGSDSSTVAQSQPQGPELFWCCPVCKSTRVQSQMWVRCNSLEVLDDTERYHWCEQCDDVGSPGEQDSLEKLPWEQTLEGERLEYLRGELRAERISYDGLHELQCLAECIQPGDVELLEAAGVPEGGESNA